MPILVDDSAPYPPPDAGPPVPADVIAYIGDDDFPDGLVEQVLAAEKAAQAHRCRVPADDAVWPRDLREALMRRCATNIANRALPLGVQSNLSDVGVAAVRVGGLDRETRRLEAPYRKAAVA